jgi:NAD(P)H dehydrogenase (quinone)
MAKILVLYATDYGNTKKLAEAVAAGARTVSGAEVTLKTAEEATKEDLLAADGIIVGTPVHMGSPDWRVKKFIDTVCSRLWMKDALIGKVGGVFATGGGFGNAGGGNEIALLSLMANFAELGMVIIPLPKNTPGYKNGGIHWGPYARSMGTNMEQEGVKEESLEAGRHHGANIARAATLLKGNEIFAKPLMSVEK